jgi:hypothetical protein
MNLMTRLRGFARYLFAAEPELGMFERIADLPAVQRAVNKLIAYPHLGTEAALVREVVRAIQGPHLLALLQEMVDLCAIGDLDENTDDGLGWAGLIGDAIEAGCKSARSRA